MYQSCDVTRKPSVENGITYAKDACPTGRMFPFYIFSSIYKIYFKNNFICCFEISYEKYMIFCRYNYYSNNNDDDSNNNDDDDSNNNYDNNSG